jgi:hypothetical protein
VSLDPGLERVVVVAAGVEEDPNLTGHLVGCSFSTPAVEAPVDSKLEVDAVSLSQELCVQVALEHKTVGGAYQDRLFS